MYNCFLKKGADVLFRRKKPGKKGGRCYFLRRGVDVQLFTKMGGSCTTVYEGGAI